MNKNQPARQVLIGVLISAAIAIGLVAILRMDSPGESGNKLSKEFEYPLSNYRKIDPALMRWSEKAKVPLPMRAPRAIAIGQDDNVLVAGDTAILILKADGTKMGEIALNNEPSCLAVAGRDHASPGRVFVGSRDHVEVFEPDGKKMASWKVSDGRRTTLTSIAVGDEDIFIADAGALVVWRYDSGGKLLGSIGKRDESRGIPGFVVPSPYFDVAMAPDGLLRIVNPGCHRVEIFTVDGHLEGAWGKSGMGIEFFCGCCSPSHIAVLSDGRIVTSEKGIFRVKVYRTDGTFQSVVAGPETLAPLATATVETCDDAQVLPPDVAVNSRGQILVLDTKARCLRVYQTKDRP